MGVGGDQSPGGDTFVIDDVDMWGEDDGIEYMAHGSRHEIVMQASPGASPRELISQPEEQGALTGEMPTGEASSLDFWSDGASCNPPVFGGSGQADNLDLI